MSSEIAEKLAYNLGDKIKDSHWDAYTIIDENSISNLYATRFGITESSDLRKFNKAFRICTEGQGIELKSINNVVSSALLPLLTFFRLFGENSEFSLNLKLENCDSDIEFDRCFYEVRNEVIKLPSCVDVALYSSKQEVMLFLESKLSEYLKISSNFEIKEGYKELYSNLADEGIFSRGDVTYDNVKRKLKDGKKAYLEGIKQSISHLIGLVQGPSQNNKGVYYPKNYLKDYQKCYTNANTIYYATIILNPKRIGVSDESDDKKRYDRYTELYSKIIGEQGDEILEGIKQWSKLKNDREKTIKVLSKPLDYHEVFANNCNLLLDNIKKFYKFGE